MKKHASRDTGSPPAGPVSSKAVATATAQAKLSHASQLLAAQLQSGERMAVQRKQLEAGFGTQAAPNNTDVVQQRQGRVQVTTQLQGVGINDDTSLESEADVMGARALQSGTTAQRKLLPAPSAMGSVLQGEFKKFGNQKGTFEGHPAGFHIHRVGGDEHFKYGNLMWTRVDFIEGGKLLPKKLEKAIEMCSGLANSKAQKIDETHKDVVLSYLKSLLKEEEKPSAVEEHKAEKEEDEPKDEEPTSGGSPYSYGDVGTTSNKNANTEEDFW